MALRNCEFASIILLSILPLIWTKSELLGNRNNVTVFQCSGEVSQTKLLINIPWNLTYGGNGTTHVFKVLKQAKTLPCHGTHNYKRTDEGSSFVFLPTGQIQVDGSGDFGVIYEPQEYCIKDPSALELEIHYCASACANSNGTSLIEDDELCVPKCCPPGYVVDYYSKEVHKVACKSSGALEWRPKFYNSSTVNLRRCIEEASHPTKYRLMSARSSWWSDGHDYVHHPRTHIYYDSQPRSSWRLLENGTVVFKNEIRNPLYSSPSWIALDKDELFCIDGLKNFHSSAVDNDYAGPDVEAHQIILQRFPRGGDPEELAESTEEPNASKLIDNNATQSESEDNPLDGLNVRIYIAALFASLLPLGLTIGAYWITWSAQNIHGWTVFSHIVSLFIMNAFLGTSHLMSLYPLAGDTTFSCLFVGVMAHFFFLSAFFWLTMVNFDLWSTFRRLRNTSGKSKDMLSFLGYACFAWGGPLLIVVVAVVLDSVYGNYGLDRDCDIILTAYGHSSRCFMTKEGEGVYLYFVIGFLILLNIGFFISLTLILHRHKKGTRRASRRKSVADITSTELFTKLFIVMGVSFSLEFISWAVECDKDSTEDISWYWVVLDVLNILVRAIFIFVIFACKRQTLKEMKKLVPDSVWQYCCAPIFPERDDSAAFSGTGTSTIHMNKITSTNGVVA